MERNLLSAGKSRTVSAAVLVIGLGMTGLSCVRFLRRQGYTVRVTDSRALPPALPDLIREMPDVEVFKNGFDLDAAVGCDQALLSPGVALGHPYVRQLQAQGLNIMGDIELFARYAQAPILAVTGSNGKSTVTALLGEMARCAGLNVAVGGNIGTPVLDLLSGDVAPDVYVLELSSFQLETTSHLHAHAAAILNVSPDHLDRYPDLHAYRVAKERIFCGDGVLVLPAGDGCAGDFPGRSWSHFSLAAPVQSDDYGVTLSAGSRMLMRGETALLPADEIPLPGDHNILNVLAALALGDTLPLPLEAMRSGVRQFRGLPHRMQPVADRDGILWIDDSKATNVGATTAALTGLDRPVVLIAGGQAKGADLTPLGVAAMGRVHAAILIGQDAVKVQQALNGVCETHDANSMEDAVSRARHHARPGDVVLLSPACASLDMFSDYQARGACFSQAVQGVAQ